MNSRGESSAADGASRLPEEGVGNRTMAAHIIRMLTQIQPPLEESNTRDSQGVIYTPHNRARLL